MYLSKGIVYCYFHQKLHCLIARVPGMSIDFQTLPAMSPMLTEPLPHQIDYSAENKLGGVGVNEGSKG